ncbi:hypothetical protein CYMTET_21141 [Cymbomonas tetramitiformis]|uniref:Hsp70-interacting protein N-terminal domain-containing protein n=1 Tax=Cymbomonas tetramitiformis TaxID=36881 RepID=A0AAE0G3F1_9CHLO|nr:hypothetical protein CYMTET_21141 [Cymbomonas tetramitiformis]
MNSLRVEQLKTIVQILEADPAQYHVSGMSFYNDYLQKLGASLPIDAPRPEAQFSTHNFSDSEYDSSDADSDVASEDLEVLEQEARNLSTAISNADSSYLEGCPAINARALGRQRGASLGLDTRQRGESTASAIEGAVTRQRTESTASAMEGLQNLEASDDQNPSIPLQNLLTLFQEYANFGVSKSRPDGKDPTISSSRLVKMLKDCSLLNNELTPACVDIVYSKCMGKGRKMDFDSFLGALEVISQLLDVPLEVFTALLEANVTEGPHLTAVTVPDKVALHTTKTPEPPKAAHLEHRTLQDERAQYEASLRSHCNPEDLIPKEDHNIKQAIRHGRRLSAIIIDEDINAGKGLPPLDTVGLGQSFAQALQAPADGKNDGGKAIDPLFIIYHKYATFGRSKHESAKHKLDCTRFVRLFQDHKLLNKKLTQVALELMFFKACAKGERTIDFVRFLGSLSVVGEVLGVCPESLSEKICSFQGRTLGEAAPLPTGPQLLTNMMPGGEHGPLSTRSPPLAGAPVSHTHSNWAGSLRDSPTAHAQSPHRPKPSSPKAAPKWNSSPHRDGKSTSSPSPRAGGGGISPGLIEKLKLADAPEAERTLPATMGSDAASPEGALESPRSDGEGESQVEQAERRARRLSKHLLFGDLRSVRQEDKELDGALLGKGFMPILLEAMNEKEAAFVMEELHDMFKHYCCFGLGLHTPLERVELKIDSMRFAKLLRESGLLDKVLTGAVCDMLFAKFKSPKQKRLSFLQFLGMLPTMSKIKRVGTAELVAHMTEVYREKNPKESLVFTRSRSKHHAFKCTGKMTKTWKPATPPLEQIDHGDSWRSSPSNSAEMAREQQSPPYDLNDIECAELLMGNSPPVEASPVQPHLHDESLDNIEPRLVQRLRLLFESYAIFGCSGRAQDGRGEKGEGSTLSHLKLDGMRFAKLCRECNLLDTSLTPSRVDSVFVQSKPPGERKMAFDVFLGALLMIAQIKEISSVDLFARMVTNDGPTSPPRIPRSKSPMASPRT